MTAPDTTPRTRPKTPHNAFYAAAWRDQKVRKLFVAAWVVALIAFVLGFAYAGAGLPRERRTEIFFAAFFAWFAICIALLAYAIAFRCPLCGKTFSVSKAFWRYTRGPRRNCIHCGLEAGS